MRWSEVAPPSHHPPCRLLPPPPLVLPLVTSTPKVFPPPLLLLPFLSSEANKEARFCRFLRTPLRQGAPLRSCMSFAGLSSANLSLSRCKPLLPCPRSLPILLRLPKRFHLKRNNTNSETSSRSLSPPHDLKEGTKVRACFVLIPQTGKKRSWTVPCCKNHVFASKFCVC